MFFGCHRSIALTFSARLVFTVAWLILTVATLVRLFAIGLLPAVTRLLSLSGFSTVAGLLAIALFLRFGQHLLLVVLHLLVHLADEIGIVGLALDHRQGIHLLY